MTGKSSIKQSLDSINKAIEGSKKSIAKFVQVDDKLLSRENGGQKNKKNEIVETDRAVKETLLVTLNKLTSAEKQGKLTEKLLKEATEQGNKEAQMYVDIC